MARKTSNQAQTAPPVNRLAIATAFLDVAVSLHIEQLRALPIDERHATIRQWMDDTTLEAAGVFTEVLPAGGGKPGDAARAFNTLAQALAALAFVPGGVPFGDRRYAANPEPEHEGGL